MMNKKIRPVIIIIFSLIFYSSNAQQSYEQIAFDYFFANIFPKEYSEKICKINFSNETETVISAFGHYKPCFDEKEVLFSHSTKTEAIVPIKTENVNEVKFIKRKSKYKINVLKTYFYKDYYYAQIEFTKKNEFTNAYYLKINKDKNVIKWCKTGVVW